MSNRRFGLVVLIVAVLACGAAYWAAHHAREVPSYVSP